MYVSQIIGNGNGWIAIAGDVQVVVDHRACGVLYMFKNSDKEIDPMSMCPCGSNNAFSDCCEPILTGKKLAETAEQLMRARYSAYTTAAMEFIFETTHPQHRGDYDHEGTRTWAEESVWTGLEICGKRRGTKEDTTGEVEFIARFKRSEMPHEHHENGQFEKIDGAWYFTEGVMVKSKPILSSKIGRNDPCSCGSGIKYKKCCGK